MLNYWISNRENATERGLIIAEWFEPEPRKSRAPLIIVITLLVTAAAIAAAYFGVRLYNASPKVRLSRSLEAAQEALQSGSYAAAEKEYLAALQIDSGNTKAYTGLCDTYAQEETVFVIHMRRKRAGIRWNKHWRTRSLFWTKQTAPR